MVATLKLDSRNNRLEFHAPDFFLRFAVMDRIQSIDRILKYENGYFSLLCDGVEVELYLPDVLTKMQLEWDFSKYIVEV